MRMSSGCCAPSSLRHRHTGGVDGPRGQSYPRFPGGHLVHRSPHLAGARVPVHDLLDGRVAGAGRIRWEAEQPEEARELHELVREVAAADDAVVPVRELAGGHRRARAEPVEHDVVEPSERTRVGVPLQAVADPVVAQSADLEQAGRLDGAGTERDAAGADEPVTVAGHDGHVPVVVDPRHLGARDQVGPEPHRRRQHGDVTAVLRVDRAREPHAATATHAGRSAVARLGVDQQRHPCGRPPETARGVHEQLVLRRQRERRERVVAIGRAGHPQPPLDLPVVRREVLVGDGPVGQSRARRHAVDRRHPEVVGVEAPRLGAERPRPPADADQVVLVGEIGRLDHDLRAAPGRRRGDGPAGSCRRRGWASGGS